MKPTEEQFNQIETIVKKSLEVIDLKDFDGTTPERTMGLKQALLLLENRIKKLEERIKVLEAWRKL